MRAYCGGCESLESHEVTRVINHQPSPHNNNENRTDFDGEIKPLTMHAKCRECGQSGTFVGRE